MWKLTSWPLCWLWLDFPWHIVRRYVYSVCALAKIGFLLTEAIFWNSLLRRLSLVWFTLQTPHLLYTTKSNTFGCLDCPSVDSETVCTVIEFCHVRCERRSELKSQLNSYSFVQWWALPTRSFHIQELTQRNMYSFNSLLDKLCLW